MLFALPATIGEMIDLKLISTTLTGNSEREIRDALRSVVDWVDVCLVVDTGVTDRTLEVAREIAGDKLVVREFAWRHDFSAARNFCLDAAHDLGGSWAITVDTDERLDLNGDDLRTTLRETPHGVVMMPDRDRVYMKERVFRLPMPVRYNGPTHESFTGYEVGLEILESASFWELPKTPEQLKRKFERDLEVLRPYVESHPYDPRWHYYLGESLKNLGKFREAIHAYENCIALRGWDEEAAWASFRAAQCREELGEFREMLEVLARGMVSHAGIAELMWYAGYGASRLGNHQQAVYWAQLAISFGRFRGQGAEVKRIGFRFLPGLFEGPFDILRFSLREVGDSAGADAAEAEYQAAKLARVRCEGGAT